MDQTAGDRSKKCIVSYSALELFLWKVITDFFLLKSMNFEDSVDPKTGFRKVLRMKQPSEERL